MTDGNDTQARIMARQLFDAWKAEQELETKATRRWWQGNASGWVAILVIGVGAIVTAGNINNRATAADTRSIQNEIAINDMRAACADRLARIETKVDQLLEEQKK